MEKRKTKYFKTGAIGFGFFVLVSLLFSACKDEALTAKQIIEKSVATHGGLENWKNIKQLSFDKEVTLFLENGNVQRKTNQFQLYQFNEPFGKIEWEEDGMNHQIIYEDKTILKIENDSMVNLPVAVENAKRTFFASEFVIKQPFDLLNQDVVLTKENDTIIEGKDNYVISVAYLNEAPDADRWYYVIEKKTFTIIANKVVLTDHTSWVENLTYDTTADFKFNAHRKSYRLNAAGEKTYLRAEYFYTNFLVN